MRVAFISHSSNLEGAERSLLDVIESLKTADHKVLVIVRETGDFTSVLNERKVPFRIINYGWWHVEEDKLKAGWLQKADIIAQEIAETLSDFSADLVYTNTSVVPFGALAAIKANLPHIWHIRELASGKIFDRYRNVLDSIGSLISNGSNRVIFNSEATLKSWLPYLRTGCQTEVVYNRLSPASILEQRNDGIFRVALIGSILPIKNQLEALESFTHTKIQQSEIELDLIGPVRDEDYYNTLVQFVNDQGLKEKVHFKGYQDDPFSAIPDLCLVCGNSEGFGRVIPEAIMRGVPVLAAKGGATDELIKEGETGFLYDGGNTRMLSNKLLELSEMKLDAHISRARNCFSELFDDQNTVGKLKAIMEEAHTEKNPLTSLIPFLNPFKDHKSHMKYVKSADLLREVMTRKMGKRK